MKNYNHVKHLIFAFIFFLISLSGLLFFYSHFKSKEAVSDQKLMDWRIEQARRDEIKSLDSSMKKIENEKVMLETHFAYSANPVPFLDTLEKMAQSVGAESAVSAVDVAKDGKSLVVGLNVSGSFESFYKFLTLIENSIYDMEFISVDVSKDGDTESGAGAWSAVVRLKLMTFIK
ncbi:MAG: hypothetical protein KBD17_02205 [Candidatus Pacebacteria bacterium]|nr:hypothetical protein [Candidatus Paceibacterota bacterium]